MKQSVISTLEIDHKLRCLMKEIAQLKRANTSSSEYNANISDEMINAHIKKQHPEMKDPVQIKAHNESVRSDLEFPSVLNFFSIEAKFNLLLQYIVKFSRLKDIEKDNPDSGYCVGIDELLAFHIIFNKIKHFLLENIGYVAIEENNVKYALFAFNDKNYISELMIERAIKHDRLDLMLQLIRSKIEKKCMTPEEMTKILEVILKHNATEFEKAIIKEFPALISEQFILKKYIRIGDVSALQIYRMQHKDKVYEMGQSFDHVVQAMALELNFNLANVLFKKGVDVWAHKISYLDNKIKQEIDPDEIPMMKLDIEREQSLKLSFWETLIQDNHMDQVVDTIERTKPNEAFMRKLLERVVDHIIYLDREVILERPKKCPDRYKKFYDAILKTYDNGCFDLDCAAAFSHYKWKHDLWPLLEKHKQDVSETSLTFIEQVQLMILKKSEIRYSTIYNKYECWGPASLAVEIGRKFSVDALAKKTALLESTRSDSFPERVKELAEIKRCQQILDFVKPKPSSMHKFVSSLFHSPKKDNITSMDEKKCSSHKRFA